MANSRRLILDTAAALFYRDGFRAVGVDTIVAESGLAKMTLYRHFPSKDDLIVAYLEESNNKFWEWFDEVIAKVDPPREKLNVFFQELKSLVTAPSCYGCPFLSAVVDFPDAGHPCHQAALKHKQVVIERFYDLSRQAGARDPRALANQLYLVMDGAFVSIRMFGIDNPALYVTDAAQKLIDAQID